MGTPGPGSRVDQQGKGDIAGSADRIRRPEASPLSDDLLRTVTSG